MTIAEFQQLIRRTYYDKDRSRGLDGTFRWLVEEIGELARAVRHGEPASLEEEFADVFAWLVSLASLTGIDLERAVGKYRSGCPKCGCMPCGCSEERVRVRSEGT
ncbi:MAG: MazG nucleotide pyrophosphohydrolase domain-containing protein [bacterium]